MNTISGIQLHRTALRRAVVAALAGLALAPAAWSQSSATDDPDARPNYDGIGEIEEVVVTATKIGTPVAEAPQSISVISSEQLDLRGVQSMTEALRYVPGTVVDNWGYEGRGYEYVILRGFDALYTGNYRDGLHQATGLYFSSFITEPYSIEQIEVLRGPASALFGQSDAGGIVNRTTKRPDTYTDPEVEVQVGNWNRKQLSVDFGGALNESESLLYRLVGTGLDTEIQQSYPDGDRPSISSVFFAPSLFWRISDDTSVTFLTDLRKGDTQGYGFYAEFADGSFSGVLQSDPEHVRYRHDQGSAGYQFEHDFNDTWSLRQNFRAARVNMDVDEVFAAGLDPDGRTLYRFSVATDERLDQHLLDTQLHASFTGGAAEHSLLFGVDMNRVDADLKFYTGDAPSLDLLDPVYGNIDKATALAIDGTQENRQTGIYLQDRIDFNEHWILNVGVRYDWVESETVEVLSATTIGLEDEAFTGRVGLIYRFDNGFAPYASYTQSFLPQGGRDFDGNPFKASEGEQYEIGVKYQSDDGRNLVTAALFDLTKDNILTPDLEHDFFFFTAGERRSRGLELEARTAIGENWHVDAAYTWLDAEVTKSNEGDQGNTPMQLPEHTASLWVDYAFSGALQGLGLSGGARYVGRRFADWQNLFESPSYTLLDAAIYYERDAWRFQLNSANLLDKFYFSSGSRVSGWYPGAERTITATVKYHW